MFVNAYPYEGGGEYFGGASFVKLMELVSLFGIAIG
jgi:hypothetical protein